MNVHHGDNIIQIGDHNSVTKGQGAADLFAAIEDLRSRVPAEDRAAVDGSLAVLREHDLADEPARQALRSIAGVAAMIGDTAVVEAVRAASAAAGRLRGA
ncbi:hypothetical protein [Actinokineospora sp. NPDC004072]